MNILLLTQHFEIKGGSDVIVHQTKRLLEAQGHVVHIFAARSEGVPDDGVFPDAQHFDAPSLTTLWKFLYAPQARARLEAFLEAHPIDAAHLHIHYGTLTSSILAPLVRRNVPIVQHLHEYRSFCSVYTGVRDGETCLDCRVGSYLPGLKYRCNRGSLLRSAVVTAEMYVADRLGAKSAPHVFLTVSDFQRKIITGQGLDPARVETLYNPVDPIFFAQDATTRPERCGVIFVGRLERYKGIFDLLEVATRLPDVPFTIIGTGNAEDELRVRITDQGLSNITLTGKLPREQIVDHLAQHRVMVVPSRWHETFGLTAVEGMAAGLPVVVTQMGGLPEVIEDGSTGWAVTAGDLETLTDRVAELARDRGLADQMGTAARTRARTVFSEEAYTTRLTRYLGGV